MGQELKKIGNKEQRLSATTIFDQSDVNFADHPTTSSSNNQLVITQNPKIIKVNSQKIVAKDLTTALVMSTRETIQNEAIEIMDSFVESI